MGALLGGARTACMKGAHKSQFIRYQCGLEDGRVLLRFSTLFSSGMTHMKGLGSASSTTSARVDNVPHKPLRQCMRWSLDDDLPTL